MHYRGIIILVLLTGILSKSFGQDISHQVLVPLSSIADISYYNVNQTVGEPVVELFTGESYALTQGFQQPSINMTGPEPPEGNGVEVYPNPVIDKLRVELFGIIEANFEIIIFGLNGTLFHRCSIECGRDYWKIESIDMTNYKRGMYFVRVSSSDGRISRFFKIEKM